MLRNDATQDLRENERSMFRRIGFRVRRNKILRKRNAAAQAAEWKLNDSFLKLIPFQRLNIFNPFFSSFFFK